MTNIEDSTKLAITELLPRAIAAAVRSYSNFLEEESNRPKSDPDSGTDLKNINSAQIFKAHHDACKVAVAHLELLLKLAGKAGALGSSGNQELLADQIANAWKEINQCAGENL